MLRVNLSLLAVQHQPRRRHPTRRPPRARKGTWFRHQCSGTDLGRGKREEAVRNRGVSNEQGRESTNRGQKKEDPAGMQQALRRDNKGERRGVPILMEVTRRPHAWRSTPMLLAVTPFPRPLTTPPVTSTYFIVLTSSPASRGTEEEEEEEENRRPRRKQKGWGGEREGRDGKGFVWEGDKGKKDGPEVFAFPSSSPRVCGFLRGSWKMARGC